ncbi:MAG: hypothetical protein ABIY70_18330, partial [Capsulimonas sp.]|uniref:hypothetical protein n=1 Tax=Capsulimonas sp. TaxID=2494211 RepID=UPI003266CA50
MSILTKRSISAAMAGDAVLVALLAKHPKNAALPAIFNAYKSQAPPVYNCLTYRIESNNPDARFRPPPAAGGG